MMFQTKDTILNEWDVFKSTQKHIEVNEMGLMIKALEASIFIMITFHSMLHVLKNIL